MTTKSNKLADSLSYFVITPKQLLETPSEWQDLCLRAINGSCAYVRRVGIFDNVCSHPENSANCAALYQPEHIIKEDVDKDPHY